MLTNSAKVCSPQERNRSLAAVIASSFCVGISFGMGYPVAAFKLTTAGAPDWVVGIIGAAPSLAVFLLLPFIPKFVRRYGPVATVIFGGVTAAIGYTALGISDSTLAWIVIRFFDGRWNCNVLAGQPDVDLSCQR